jgi:SAM-dependent methyltransferase
MEAGEAEEFYSEDYYSSDSTMGYRDYVSVEELHRNNASRIIRVLDSVRDMRGSAVLDIGCACGYYLDEFRRQRGCRTTGFEISSFASGIGVRMGLDIRNAMFHASLVERESFDVALLIGTIEHLSDPREVLREINSALRPGGLLAITTIDTRGLIPLYKIKPPEHLIYFNHGNLRELLRQCGFRVVRLETHYSRFYIFDILHRLSKFYSSALIESLSRGAHRWLPRLSVTIPTNEMIVIAARE